MGMNRCEICGRKQEDDLFMAVAQEKVCSVCIADLGGIPTQKGIDKLRDALGLGEGEYLDRSDEETRDVILTFLGQADRRRG